MFPFDSKVTIHNMPEGTEHIPSPLHFTYPFFYEPHPLCVAAAEEIKPLCRKLLEGENGGKMFGVLIVETPSNKAVETSEDKAAPPPSNKGANALGSRSADTPSRYYLAAFSGIIQGTYHHEGFVPPVYDLQQPTSYFQREQSVINAINTRIAEGDTDPELFEERRTRSHNLQKWLFQQFVVSNNKGEQKDLTVIFEKEKPILTEEEYYGRKQSPTLRRLSALPPAGSGECCAPKLLQYAYTHSLIPIAMAEFWLGPSPKDEPRIDGNYYPACHSKCKPILHHMLQGLDVEENPMLRKNRETAAKVEYLYEDESIAVLYKPSGLLSAPGKDDVPSLLDIVRQKYPEAMYAHRLDMDTSGIMVFGLNTTSYKHLQEQFFRHQVKKHYIAILDGEVSAQLPASGTIRLPLLPNPFDRPRQMVNREHGKQAITHYEILSVGGGRTRVKFNPQTGRTHQLRVHSAHPEGLGVPILGDNLYGTPSDRLYLHAEQLEFTHPTTGQPMVFFKEMNTSYPCLPRE